MFVWLFFNLNLYLLYLYRICLIVNIFIRMFIYFNVGVSLFCFIPFICLFVFIYLLFSSVACFLSLVFRLVSAHLVAGYSAILMSNIKLSGSGSEGGVGEGRGREGRRRRGRGGVGRGQGAREGVCLGRPTSTPPL